MNNDKKSDGTARAAVKVIAAMAEAIRDLGTVPAGILYAHVCGTLTIESFENVIGILKGAGLVEEKASHELRWIGPRISA